MIIILEGPDKVGKTTLVNSMKLMPRFAHNFKFFKGTVIKNMKEMCDTTRAQLQIFEKEPSVNWICDRFYYPSDIIYRPIFENIESPIASYMREEIESRLFKLDTCIVILTSGLDTLYHRFDEEGDEYVVRSQFSAIINKYNDFFEGDCTLPCCRINIDCIPRNSIIRTIESFLDAGVR